MPAEKFVIFAVEDDLALRADPAVGGYLWKRMPLGTELTCLEPKATVKAKLGVNGQWINIQDPKGDQGYVAAWFVSDTKDKPAAPAASAPASAPATSATTKPATTAAPAMKLPPGALAFIPTEELSFRTQPVISPETVIRRVPPTEMLVSIEPAKVAIAESRCDQSMAKSTRSSNKEGYVAAWYVKYASGSQPLSLLLQLLPPPRPRPLQRCGSRPALATGGILKVKATLRALHSANNQLSVTLL